MAQRNPVSPDEIPRHEVPQLTDGELGAIRDKWISQGCLPDDPVQDNLKRLEAMALGGELSRGDVEKMLQRLDESRTIRADVADAIRDILSRAHIPDARQSILEEIRRAKSNGEISDHDQHLIRRMIGVQAKEGNITDTELVELLALIGIEAKKA